MASWNGRSASSPRFFLPSEQDAPWEKAHGRLERRRIKRLAVSPEEIGLCGCWQILAIKRDRIELAAARAKPSQETQEPELGYYVSSLGHRETSDQALLDLVRGHWSAIENGVHHTRDVSFGEDRSRIAQPTAARVMATLRNLAIGIYNLEQERSDANAASLPAWQRKLTASTAMRFIL